MEFYQEKHEKNLSGIVALAAIMGILFFTGCDPNAGENDSGSNSGTNYTVSFLANGGSGTMEAQTFTSGVAQGLNRNDFIYAGKFINGWNTVADGSGTSYKECESVKMTGNTTLYAQWTTSNITYSADSTKGICLSGIVKNDSYHIHAYVNNVEMVCFESNASNDYLTQKNSTWTRYFPFVSAGNTYYVHVECVNSDYTTHFTDCYFNVKAIGGLGEYEVTNADEINYSLETGNILTRSVEPTFTENSNVKILKKGTFFDVYSGDNYSGWTIDATRWDYYNFPLKDVKAISGWKTYDAVCEDLEKTGKYYSHSKTIIEVDGYDDDNANTEKIQFRMNDYMTTFGDWNSDNNSAVSNTTDGVKFSIPVSSAGKYSTFIFDNDNGIQLYAEKEMSASGNFEVVYPFVKKNTSYNFHIYFMEYVTTEYSGSSEPVFNETLAWTTDGTMEDKDVGKLTMSCTSLDSGGINVKCTQSKDICKFLKDSGYTVSTWQMNISKHETNDHSVLCSYSVSSADQTFLFGDSGLDITESSLGSWTIENKKYTANSIISLLAGTGWEIDCQINWGNQKNTLVGYAKSVYLTK